MSKFEKENKTCKASELIAALQAKIAEHGDLPIYVEDADTNWILPIGLVFVEKYDVWPKRFTITANYNGRPEGDLCN